MADQSNIPAEGIRQAGDLQMDFGEVSARLARAIAVPDVKLTKFHARLQNFRRLGWPEVSTVKGKATAYTRENYIDFAVVIELTVLGLSPEDAIQTARDNRDAIHFDPVGTLGPCTLRLRPQIGTAPVHSEIQLYIGHYLLGLPEVGSLPSAADVRGILA
jgi:hypothetical protein